jgi:hypothetical protein
VRPRLAHEPKFIGTGDDPGYRCGVIGRRWRVRLIAIAAASGFLALGLVIRLSAGSGEDVDGADVDGAGALTQYSGTALYASMIYAGVFLVFPAVRPSVAGAAAITFCWLVEFLQLTGVPSELSERSLLARLVLGVEFDAVDLAWYAVGVLPLVVLHRVIDRRRGSY